jgi:hypothetical protein
LGCRLKAVGVERVVARMERRVAGGMGGWEGRNFLEVRREAKTEWSDEAALVERALGRRREGRGERMRRISRG